MKRSVSSRFLIEMVRDRYPTNSTKDKSVSTAAWVEFSTQSNGEQEHGILTKDCEVHYPPKPSSVLEHLHQVDGQGDAIEHQENDCGRERRRIVVSTLCCPFLRRLPIVAGRTSCECH